MLCVLGVEDGDGISMEGLIEIKSAMLSKCQRGIYNLISYFPEGAKIRCLDAHIVLAFIWIDRLSIAKWSGEYRI